MLAEVIRLIFVLASAVGGAYVAKQPFIERSLTAVQFPKNLALILFIILCSGLGYVVGGFAGRRIAKLVIWVEEKTQKITGSELLMGISGLILGLVIASLIASPLNAALKPALKVIAPYIIALVYLILGYLGFTIFMRKKPVVDILPNVTLQKQTDGGQRDKVLDSSVIIDGRIIYLAKAGFIEGKLVVPRFVLNELQLIADSSDDLKRARGRRGLEILEKITKDPSINLEIAEDDYPEIRTTDEKLVRYSKDKESILVTNDYNLGKIAILDSVKIFNINELAASLRPIVHPGEELRIPVIKEGKEKNQGIGYLDDGTMVVIENGKKLLGEEVDVIVSSVLQTSAGKMIFSRIKEIPVKKKE